METPPAMGVAAATNFQGIAVTAPHSHMLAEEPRRLFLRFWANDAAVIFPRGP